MRRLLAAAIALLAVSAATAQSVQELVRSAESYRAHGDLAARMAANDLLGVFKTSEKYFRSEAPDSGARLLVESAADFIWYGALPEAKTVLGDSLFASSAVKADIRYFQAGLLWAIGAGAEPARQQGREAIFGRVLLIKALALDDPAAIKRLEDFLPASKRVALTAPTASAILAAAGRVPARELATLDSIATQWPTVDIPLSGNMKASFYLYDPGLLFAYARALLLEASKAAPTKSYMDVARAFLLGDRKSTRLNSSH